MKMFSTTYNEKEKLWCGRDIPALYNPLISLAQPLLNSMNIFGSKIAQISDNNGNRMTFNEIKSKTIRAAQNLQALGYKPKEVFTIIARNSHHVAPVAFASIAIGCPLNPLDASFGKTELIHMLTIIKPALVFCDVECYELVDDCLKQLGNEANIFTFGGSAGRSEPVENLFKETHKENQFIPVKIDGSNEIALITCSSGTTGLPKGVCLSHAAMLDFAGRFTTNDSSDVMLCFSSLYWISGVITLLAGTLCGATRIITSHGFSPELQLRLIEKYKATFTLNAPLHILLMMKCDRFSKTDISSIKYLYIGGSKAPFHIKTDIVQHIPNGNIIDVYGMSELVGGISFHFYPSMSGKDSTGRLMSGCCIKIVDDHGNRCGVNVDGEICIKMSHRFLGYYGNQKATDDLIDEEGFVVSGDIGHYDDDGDLFITGRKKDLMKYCNMQISPAEIDSFLTESPDIKSACVVGIPDAMGDLPAAVIVRAEGSSISEKNIFDMTADHFADHYKLRGGVYFVDSLPTTPSGKIQRIKVNEMAITLFNKNKTQCG